MTLERTVEDNYIVYFERDEVEDENIRKYTALLMSAEELSQQHGPDIFSYKRFEFTKSIAAMIKDRSIVAQLEDNGYVVEQQSKFIVEGSG
jgi:hypothetical protein